ncbi:MAG: putative sulfate/molybdate transporter [Halovenus sp.]
MVSFDVTTYRDQRVTLSWNEVTGAIGDSVTVLPLVVAIGVLTELSLTVMFVWFGVFQIVWGLYYRAPISVEPMKALAALLLAGTVTTGEFLLAGLLLGVVLLVVGATGTIGRVEQYIGSPVVRGIQFGVALLLLKTGLQLGSGNLQLAGLAAVIAGGCIAVGYWNLTAILVLVVGGGVAVGTGGVPEFTLPTTEGLFLITTGSLTVPTVEATVTQLAMTVGNAALAASVLMSDYFDRDVSPDELSTSMGVMNLLAVPLGAIPMCHGSGGIAGKYAFGARTAGANVVLGVAYVGVALGAAGFMATYPVSILGVVLVLIALQLAKTSLLQTDAYPLVVGIGLLAVLVNLGVAFVAGVVAFLYFDRQGSV